MKVGVLTFYSARNIGAQIQAFALLITLRNLGYDAEFIRYEPEYLKRPYSLFRNIRLEKGLPFCIKQMFFFVVRDMFVWVRTYFHYKRFQKDYFNISSKSFFSPQELVLSDYGAIIVGSDQIWNPELTGKRLDDLYTLNYQGNAIKRISYAASLEMSRMSEKDKDILVERLKLFDAISVREKIVADFLNCRNLKASLVLDPTLLLNENEWLCYIQKNRLVKKRYVLVYQARGGKKAILDYASNKANELNAEIIDASGMNYRVWHNGMQFVNPLEFLNLVYFSEFVVTASFHGTALSIILHKPFVSVLLDDGRDDRVVNLLNCAGLTNCSKKLNDMSMPVIFEDYSKKRLNEMRNESLEFIKKSLEG